MISRYKVEYTDGKDRYFETETLQEFLWIFRMEGDHAVNWIKLQPWVVCAACRNSKSGMIVTGARHFDPIMRDTINAMIGDMTDRHTYWMKYGWSDADQGFIDQWGHFLTREEAAEIAYENGQTKDRLPVLFSEDLY